MIILNNREARLIEDVAVKSLVNYVYNAQLEAIILNVSGDINSAVMASLTLRAIEKLGQKGHRCRGYFEFIGIGESTDRLKKSKLLSHELGFTLNEHDFTNLYRSAPMLGYVHGNEYRLNAANNNLKSHLRMAHLRYLSQIHRGIVLDNTDLSEYLLGLWCRNGDDGDIKLIQQLTKTEVADIGEYLKLPSTISTSTPKDRVIVTENGHSNNQFKMSYLKMDYCLSRLILNGFEINGIFSQLKNRDLVELIKTLSVEVEEPTENIVLLATQALNTSFKRKYGDNVALLMNRTTVNLPLIGTGTFNRRYLEAINKKL